MQKSNKKFSKIGFILAMAGSAVGLGNIWRFPYMVGENGGGAFVLIYLFTIVFVGISLFVAESLIGKKSGTDAMSSFETLANKNGSYWKLCGLICFAAVMILMFYLPVSGWLLKYLVASFGDLPSSAKLSQEYFSTFVSSNPMEQFLYFNIAFFVSFWIVSKGIIDGIEKLNLILMPTLIVIMFLLCLYALSLEGFAQALEFLFVPDWSKITNKTILSAVGHAFFTMSLGTGTVLTFSASLPKETNIVKSGIQIAIIDTLIAFVAGVILFTFLFHDGLEPSAGPGLVFVAFPSVVSHFGLFGNVVATAFFLSLAFAAITSVVSIIEPASFTLENRLNISRQKSMYAIGAVVYLGAILCICSLLDTTKESFMLFGKGYFDLFDFLVGAVVIPVGGIIIAVFVGHAMKKEEVEKIVLNDFYNPTLFNIWYANTKYITPIAVLGIMLGEFLK